MQVLNQSIRSLPRRGAILVLAALLLIVIFAMTAFVVDAGYMSFTATELQNAADGGALAGVVQLPNGTAAVVAEVQSTAAANIAGGKKVTIASKDVEFGRFDTTTRTFFPGDKTVNAIRVTARLTNQGYFFAPIMGYKNYTQSRSAVAMLNPRDIAFVVDLSGSMNDDTEPVWATNEIGKKFATSYPTVGNDLAQKLYNDFNFGTFPGKYETVGQPLGVPGDWYAFAVMTMDDGVLTKATIPATYRIANTDSEAVRKKKAYNWIIDNQLAKIMPNANPKPNSSDTANYALWEKYLDYVMAPCWVGYYPDPPPDDGGGGGGGGGGGDPPPPPPPSPPSGSIQQPYKWFEYAERGRTKPRFVGQLADGSSLGAARLLLTPAVFGPTTPGVPRRGSTEGVYVPDAQDDDRIYNFNNPNYSLHPGADGGAPWWFMNTVGYITYTQYIMDWGRDRSPRFDNDKNVKVGGATKTEFSVESPFCKYHPEVTAGGTYNFPCSEQPMHAVRRALIAAIEEVKNKNTGLAKGVGDFVSIVTYDAADADHAPTVRFSLSDDYSAAKISCTTLQAVSDIGNSTATENGLKLARDHIKPKAQGGQGRSFSTKVVVLCTDGVPNVWQTDATTINGYIKSNGNADYYGSDYVWYNSALMQAAQAKAERTKMYSVGMGLGADLDFMDRMARIGGTAEKGLSPRGTGNPADYEAQLTTIFKKIINTRGGRLVK